MQVSLSTFVDFLAPAERVRAVRLGWQQHGRPYDPAPTQTDLELEHTLMRWVADSRSGRGPARSGGDQELAATVLGVLSGPAIRDLKVSALTTRLLDLEISLRPVVEATLDGQAVLIYVYLGPRPATPDTIRGAISLIEHRQQEIGQPRPALVLDVPSGGRLCRPADGMRMAELEQVASRFRAMVLRFGRLADKANIYSYLPDTVDIPGWDLNQLNWSGVRRVFDAGCGAGRHLARLSSVTTAEAVGMDPSVGAVTKARDNSRSGDVQVVAGQLEQLPFAAGRFDAVLAMQMLYNLPDLDRGLAEVRRVLAPGGRLLAATNSLHNLEELNDLFGQAVQYATGRAWTGTEVDLIQARFTVENGSDQLRRHFATVDLRRFEQSVPITSAEAVAAHISSSRVWREGAAQGTVPWDRVTNAAGEIAAERIAMDGSFVATIRQGVFICSDPFKSGQSTDP